MASQKLTREECDDIRRMYADRTRNIQTGNLAHLFRVSSATILKVLAGKYKPREEYKMNKPTPLTITEADKRMHLGNTPGQPDYSNTYWSHKGTHEALIAEMNKIVPSSGEVENADENPALEKFRVASNCYYDLYNNGLGNRGKQFEEVFGFSAFDLGEDCNGFSVDLTQELIDRTESTMDTIILAAYREQLPNLPMPWCEPCQSYHHATIDITPVGMTTPEGIQRVRNAQQEWDSATHLLANTLKEILDDPGAGFYSYGAPDEDTRHQLKALIGARDRKQEAFLRAVAGR